MSSIPLPLKIQTTFASSTVSPTHGLGKDSSRTYQYQSEIQQMMFVFGEVNEPLDETTRLVEDIVRVQVVELLIQAVEQAKKRGSKTINPDDLIFLLRHDRARVHRLKSYLSWKEVRRIAKDKDGKAADVPAEDLLDEENPSGAQTKVKVAFKQNKVRFGWDPLAQFASVLSGNNDDDDEEDEKEAYQDQLERLRQADEITKNMNHDEYMSYSECRQASFIFKKAKRFKDWCQMQNHYDQKVTADLMDTLGFLSYEMVARLTEVALAVSKEWQSSVQSKSPNADTGEYLFQGPPEDQKPLQPAHITEAYRRLQLTHPNMSLYRGGSIKTPMILI